MDDNIISKVFMILLFAAIMLGITALYMNNVDGNVQTYVSEETVRYVDSCRAKGCISPSDYMSYVEYVSSCGEFKVEIVVNKETLFPETSDKEGSIVTGETYSYNSVILQDELLKYMFMSNDDENVVYPLETGDRITVNVVRSGAGYTAMASLFGLGAKEGDAVFTYGGTVYHNY